MKNFFIAFAFVTINLIQAQSDKGIFVEYESFKNNFTNTETLIANQGKALFIINSLDTANKKGKEVNVDENTNTYTINQKRIVLDKKSYYLQNNSDIIYFTNQANNKSEIIKDSLPEIIWNLKYPEVKLIGDFKCRKATTKFRGSDLIAWYCLDLPFPFGPWKMKGLPGLILELNYEDNGVFEKWTAKKVIVPFQINVDFDFDKKLPLKNLKTLIQENEAEILNRINAIKERLPAGNSISSSSFKREGIEKTLEWER
jgi:GLPGLI family protein